ncbi:MAG: DUF1559 domain-containing protein [Mariniblastus sp.]
MRTLKTHKKMPNRTILIAALMTLSIAFTPPAAEAQISKLLGSSKDEISTEFIPRSSVISATLFPAKLNKDPNFSLFPREIVTAWGKKELGFDPMLIREATLVVQDIENFEKEPGWSIVMQFEEMQGLSGKMLEPLSEKKIGGKTVFSGKSNGMPSFMVFDESTVFFGNEEFFEDLMTADASGDLATLAKKSSVNGQLQFFMTVKTMRTFLSKTVEDAFGKVELPPQIEGLKQLPQMIDTVQIGVDTNNKLLTKIVLNCPSDTDAEATNELLLESFEFAIEMMITQMAGDMNLGDPVQAATLAYTRRMAEDYQEKLTPVVKGSTLTIEVNDEASVATIIAGMVLPSIGYNSASYTPQMTPENDARQVALSFHNFESAYGHFPPLYMSDRDGKPLLGEDGKPLMSGRVGMLPFLEQNNLVSALRTDEPWDSEHNSQYTRMTIPQFLPAAESGMVTLRYPVFPNSVWDGEGKKHFGDITDGTSNTIMAIQVAEKNAVNWANPEPWNLSATNPMQSVFGDLDEVIVTMLDGSVQKLKKSEMTNKKLKAMLTISGGEVIR